MSTEKLTVTMQPREIPVIREVDVLVAGGGYAGFGAAMAAARAGKRVLLVEQQSCLGGLVTMGLVALTYSYVEGIGLDLFVRLTDDDALNGRFVDPEKTKRVLETMLIEAGVEILYCTSVTDAIVEDNVIKGAVIFNKSGFSAVLAKRVIDATGDGDLAAFAGVPFESGCPQLEDYNQSASLVARFGNVDMERYNKECGQRFKGDSKIRYIQEKVEEAVASGEMPYMIDKRFNWVVVIPGRDINHQELAICFAHSRRCRCLDQFDITRMYIEGREQNRILTEFARKYLPGFENAWLIDTAPLLGVRESRRIMCEYKVTGQDLVENRRFEDAVMRDMHALDAHHPTEPGHIKYVEYPMPDGSIDRRYVMPGGFRELPYRAFVTQKIDNLFVAGRNVSSDFMGQSGTRLVMACLNMGQVTGTAAALSIDAGVTPRNLDYHTLRAALIELGMQLDEDPVSGVDGLSTSANLTREDITTPEDSDRFHVSAARAKDEVGAKWRVRNDLADRIAKRRQAYSDTGGDVGTNLE